MHRLNDGLMDGGFLWTRRLRVEETTGVAEVCDLGAGNCETDQMASHGLFGQEAN